MYLLHYMTSIFIYRKYKFRRLSNSPASLPSTPPPVSMGNASHVNTPLTNQTRSQGILISPKPTTRGKTMFIQKIL